VRAPEALPYADELAGTPLQDGVALEFGGRLRCGARARGLELLLDCKRVRAAAACVSRCVQTCFVLNPACTAARSQGTPWFMSRGRRGQVCGGRAACHREVRRRRATRAAYMGALQQDCSVMAFGKRQIYRKQMGKNSDEEQEEPGKEPVVQAGVWKLGHVTSLPERDNGRRAQRTATHVHSPAIGNSSG